MMSAQTQYNSETFFKTYTDTLSKKYLLHFTPEDWVALAVDAWACCSSLCVSLVWTCHAYCKIISPSRPTDTKTCCPFSLFLGVWTCTCRQLCCCIRFDIRFLHISPVYQLFKSFIFEMFLALIQCKLSWVSPFFIILVKLSFFVIVFFPFILFSSFLPSPLWFCQYLFLVIFYFLSLFWFT